MTGIKCTANEKFISSHKCHLKPVRSGMGMLNVVLIPKNLLDDIWVKNILFYKFGTIYRPWLLHFDVDYCQGVSGRGPTDIISLMIFKYWKIHGITYKCPLKNTINLVMNADNSSNNIMFDKIPRLPQGDYKILNRIHTKGNETIFLMDVKFTLKSKSGTSMLEMG